MMGSYDECGKIVHRPCSNCISNVQKIDKNFIEFSLLTQTWSKLKLSWLEFYKSYLGGQINNMTGNTGEDQKEIEDNEKKNK